MGASNSKAAAGQNGKKQKMEVATAGAIGTRNQAITGGGAKKTVPKLRPANSRPILDKDIPQVEGALGKLLLFTKIDRDLQQKVVQGMWERDVDAGAHMHVVLCMHVS